MSNEGQRLLGCSRRSLAATFLFVCTAGVSVTLLVFSSSGERTSVSVPETVSHGSTRLPSLKFSVDAPSPADVTDHLSHLSSLRSRVSFGQDGSNVLLATDESALDSSSDVSTHRWRLWQFDSPIQPLHAYDDQTNDEADERNAGAGASPTKHSLGPHATDGSSAFKPSCAVSPLRIPADVSARFGRQQRPIGAGEAEASPADDATASSAGSSNTANRGPPASSLGPANMCLRQHGLISEYVRVKGFWPDCIVLIEIYSRLLSQGHSGFYVDAGANIGACVAAMLEQTNAYVLAFEPLSDNLFYLTSTLLSNQHITTDDGGSKHNDADTSPQAGAPVSLCPQHGASGSGCPRVAVLPVALGNDTHDTKIYPIQHNLAHASLDEPTPDGAADVVLPPEPVSVRRFDDLVHIDSNGSDGTQRLLGDVLSTASTRRDEAGANILLVKLDVEGYECRVLEGMTKWLAAGRVKAVQCEVIHHHLETAGCTPQQLVDILTRNNFSVFDMHGNPIHQLEGHVWQEIVAFHSSVTPLGALTTERYRVYDVAFGEEREWIQKTQP